MRAMQSNNIMLAVRFVCCGCWRRCVCAEVCVRVCVSMCLCVHGVKKPAKPSEPKPNRKHLGGAKIVEWLCSNKMRITNERLFQIIV